MRWRGVDIHYQRVQQVCRNVQLLSIAENIMALNDQSLRVQSEDKDYLLS